MKRDKKGSLTRELAVILVGLVAGTIMLCWFINTSFLEKYYMLNKQDSLIDGYDVINGASETGELNSSEFDVTFDNLCANGNIAVMIISSNRAIVRSSVNDNQVILMEFMNILFGDDRSQTEILQRSDNYVIQKQTDTRLSSEYMVLYGTLSNGNLILMRTAVESIRESAKISNQFLVYVGVLAIAISAIVTVFVSKRITTPISELKSANNELKQDIEKKTEIDEMRKEFLSNVSHELKTPLALIQGYAEGLQECINDDAQSRDFYCEVIMDEADKMNQMVKKLLTLNQLEFGNEVVPMERFNLTELIHGIINSSSILLEQNDISVAFDESGQMDAWGDEFKVEEVVTNYLSNAIHHAEFDKKIRIWYTRKDSVVRVSVFNTGKQIPEEDLDNVWIKFYKVDKARTREYGGSGIGLSIVKAIMESFHRECGVLNHEDGVEFWFELDTEKTGIGSGQAEDDTV